MGRKKRKPKPKQPPRKQEKSKQKRRKPITRKPRKKRAPTPEQRIVNEALRQSPDMTAMLEKNNWELFVPPDSLEGEGVAVAASAQAKKHADVDKFLDMKQKYGEPLAFEHLKSKEYLQRRSRPPTPVVPFGDYMEEQDAETQREKGDESLLNDFAGTTFDTNKSKNEFTFSFPGTGGKRKSRRRKKSRRRRKKSRRRRKTKRKSRRRRK